MDPPSNVAVDVRNLVRLSPDLAGRGNPYLHYLLPFLHSVLVLSVKARFPEGDAKIEQAILTARSFLSESSAFREYNLDDDEVVGARNSGDLEASQRAARRLQRVEMAMFLFAATNACLEGKLDQA
ncbi:MAG: hypothetical protein KJP02_04415, partial [Octadecabacter sp.]|nr:hypothetical protein [Octadecabacter sp.]